MVKVPGSIVARSQEMKIDSAVEENTSLFIVIYTQITKNIGKRIKNG